MGYKSRQLLGPNEKLPVRLHMKGIVAFVSYRNGRVFYTVVHVDIYRRRITCLAITKLCGIVVMMLGWHAKGPGFKPHMKLLLHNSTCEAKVSNEV